MPIEPLYIYIAPSEWTDLINALSHLIGVLVGVFGLKLTGLILFLLLVGSVAYRRWREYKKDSGWRAVVEEKERTIQRLAEENRNHRIVILKEVAHWTDDEIDRFVMKNEFKDGVAARKVLEGEEEKTDRLLQQVPPSKERAPRGRRRK